jgi:hypothetical protein
VLRFMNGLDGLRGGPLFGPSTIQLMDTEGPAFDGAADYYGVGMEINRTNAGFNWWKSGDYAGTNSFVFRYANGLAFAAIFNSEPNSSNSNYPTQIENALPIIGSLPTQDQLPNFTSSLVGPSLAPTNPVVSGATFQPGIV